LLMFSLRKIFSTILLLLISAEFSYGQSETNLDKKILFRREQTGFIMVHSGGFGLGYRNGKSKTYFRKFIWEIDGLNIKHPKEFKIASYWQNSKNFIYGKLNELYVLRGGVGQQHVLNGKPYWGGVEVRIFYSGGLLMGFTKPQYMYIVNYESDGSYSFSIERFDPDIHDITTIYSRAPFFKRFDHIGVYPGAYAKAGLSFEYGADDKFVKTLECGAFLDAFYKNVPIMAKQKNNFLFLNVYIAFHLGKRKF
jgi:hypothetical protein